ncbi:GHKL domain-containing protein [Limosilactobacillus reuteri]|uniref:GHKL domain-containing protein n=1 Tax=Limosilactobacillus reuteri TaxID=1598 RepID=UPI001E321D80|nr:GHKL domain-containing protein [Limosilactobacillus reuteri]MCC4424589.1 GHKL domain-containing protein [Limosilactobacillus reuteri]
MIQLTFFQSFISDFLNIVEIITIYRLLVKELTVKKILIDCGISIIILLIGAFILSSFYIVLIVFYLWLFDRIKMNPYILLNSIFAMFTAVILSSLFDLVDHCTYVLFIQKNTDLSLVGWLIPFNDFLTATFVSILILKLVRPKINKFIENFPRPFHLWEITAVFFMLYIWLTAIAEKEGIANKYASLLLIMYFIIIIISVVGFLNFVKSSEQNQHQQRLIDNYKAQIASAHKINKQYNEIRRERHDTRNMLLSIQGYIRDHKDREAEKLLATFLQNNIAEKHYGEIDNALDKIKISGLHNLIKEKAYKIVEKGIPFSFEVNAEIDKLPGSEIKTARIIGILMDNAIEATFKQAKPYIQFALLKHSPEVYELVIANSIEQKLNINTALKFEHSTKEGHQGIGLSNVTQLVENDDHYSFSAEVKDKVIMMTCFIQGK